MNNLKLYSFWKLKKQQYKQLLEIPGTEIRITTDKHGYNVYQYIILNDDTDRKISFTASRNYISDKEWQWVIHKVWRNDHSYSTQAQAIFKQDQYTGEMETEGEVLRQLYGIVESYLTDQEQFNQEY